MHRWIICGVCILAAGVLYMFTRTAAALLFLYASIVLPLAALFLAASCAGKVFVSLSMPSGIQKGVPAHCVLLAENRSVIPVARVWIMLSINNTLTGQAESVCLNCSVGPRRKREMEFVFNSATCGQYLISCEEVRVYDFLELHGFRRSMGIRKRRVIPPETFSLRVSLTGNENLGGDSEVFSLSRKGQDYSEPFQIREYAEGDSPKQIHWKLTQKLGRYIVTDPSLELERSLLILWDSALLPPGTPAQVPDALAESLVSVCLSLTEDEVPYVVAWKNEETGNVVFKEVSTMDDIYDVMSGILSTNTNKARASLIPDILHELGGKRYPLIAYFAYQLPEALMALEETGRLTAFICGTADNEIDTAKHACLLFSPDNYPSVLQNVTI